MALKISDTPNFRSQILNKNNIEIMFKMVSNVTHIVMNRKIKDLWPYYKQLLYFRHIFLKNMSLKKNYVFFVIFSKIINKST